MFPLAAAFSIGTAGFFLLAGYEFARSASSSLFIASYGADRLPFVMALSPVGTFALMYSYGLLLTWLGPRVTLAVMTVFSGIGLMVCFLMLRADVTWGTGLLFVLREAYIVVLIEQYWSFIDSTLTRAQARRYNGPICGIASLGAIGGGAVVGLFAERFGTEFFVVMAALLALPATAFGLLAYRLGGEPPDDGLTPSRSQVGWGLFSRYRTLSSLFIIIVSTQVISTALDLHFSLLLEEARPVTDQRTAYLGFFWTGVNVASFVLQFMVAPLLLSRMQPVFVLVLLPVVHVATAGALLVEPSIVTASVAFLVFKSLDYSIFRAAKEILYLPLPFAARYRSKQLIDAFGYRTSKGVTSSAIATAGEGFHLPPILYPVVAISACLLWLVMALSRLSEASQMSEKTLRR